MPKISVKFQWRHTKWGDKYRWDMLRKVNIDDFQLISRYISETLHDRDIVTMED